MNGLNKLIPFGAINKRIADTMAHAGFQRYFKNTGWMFFGQMFSVISVLIGIWIARYFGPEKFGIFNYALAFVGLFSFVANLGISSILVRDLVKYPEKRDKLMGTAFVLSLAGGFIAFLGATVASFLFVQDIFVRALIILWAFYFIIASDNVIAWYFQANVQAKVNAKTQIATTLISSALKIALILSGQGLLWLMAIYLAEYGFGAIFYVYNYKRNGLLFRNWSFDKQIAKEFLSVSWLIMLSTAASYIYLRIDQVMIGSFLDSAAVGLYSAAVRLSEIWYFIPGIICSSLFPAIVNAKMTDEKKYLNRLNRLYIFLAGIALLIAIPLSLLAPWIIEILYGEAYLGAIDVLRIYIWSGIGMFLGVGVSQYLLSDNKLYTLFFLSLVPMVVNIGLNLLFIPKFGIAGAAWATLISYSIGPAYVLIKQNIPKRTTAV